MSCFFKILLLVPRELSEVSTFLMAVEKAANGPWETG